jgi:hypothetical protein
MATKKPLRAKAEKTNGVYVPNRPKNLRRPLGVLPIPAKVEKMVRGFMPPIASEEAIWSQILEDTLRWFYGGQSVLVRISDTEVEVRAVGDDIFKAIRALTPEEKLEFGLAQPDPWNCIGL